MIPKTTVLIRFIVVMVLLSFGSPQGTIAQCSNCSANYPSGTFSTNSATLTTVATCIYGGEYSYYNVVAGETYVWTTCGDASFDTQLTLSSGTTCGSGFLAYNDDDCGLQSTITWTATFTGTVTLLVSSYNCVNQAACMTVQWACVTCGANPPADYTMPTVGINGEYVGSCLVSDCGPFTFADDGNSFGNYSNGINQIYRVFCPSTAGQCMQVTFSEFNMFNNLDFLLVKNGPTQNSPDITTAPNSPTAYAGITALHSNLNGSTPFSFTSTDPSGCLTFRQYSSGSNTAPGWYATLQCVPCAGGPNGTDNNDCFVATPICSSASISSNATGPGIVAEGCTGTACPAGGENHTNWYTFTAQTSGSLNFLINPDDNTDDYDYAVYGPNVSCGNLGAPIRCSDAAVTGNTGLTNVSPNQNTEDVTGDGFTETMTVTAGDQYFLVIDEWSPNAGSGYTLSFSGTASLDCTVLPVELSEFNVAYIPDEHVIDLHWITASEMNSDRFEVERSFDGINYEVIAVVKAQGTTTNETQYYTIDKDPKIGVNYYRLNQIDIDGGNRYSETRTVNILDDGYDILSFYPNPTSGSTEVIFNSYRKEDVQLTVLSFDGKPLVKTTLAAEKGGNRFDLDLSNLNGNMFIVTITTSDKVYSGKLIKH